MTIRKPPIMERKKLMTDKLFDELADRCEAATGPDRRINYDIAAALGKAQFYAGGSPDWHFTASIDAEDDAAADAACKPMAKAEDNDRVFSLDMGFGNRLNVYVHGGPEDFRVAFSDPDTSSWIGIDKRDWERIVERVKEQF